MRVRKGKKEAATPTELVSEVFDPVDVSPAAEEVEAAMDAEDTELETKAATTPTNIILDVNMDAIEGFAIQAFKFTAKVAEGVIDFNKEHDVIGKVKGAVEGAIKFEKDNEVLIKTRAALEVGVDELTPLAAAAKEQLSKSAKKNAPTAKNSEPPKTGAKNTKTTTKPKFEMPKFDLPKFK